MFEDPCIPQGVNLQALLILGYIIIFAFSLHNLDETVTEEPLDLPDQTHKATPLVLLLLRQPSLCVHN